MATRMTTSKVSLKTNRTEAPKVARARKTELPAAPVGVAAPTHEQIAARAYERFCAGGCVHGHDVEDWLAAERELRAS